MNFKAKVINTAYEMSTILSFAFTLDFIIKIKDMNQINRLILIAWLALTTFSVFKIVLNRIVLNQSREPLFEKILLEIKKNFSEDESAIRIYMSIGFIILFIKIAIPFIIIL